MACRMGARVMLSAKTMKYAGTKYRAERFSRPDSLVAVDKLTRGAARQPFGGPEARPGQAMRPSGHLGLGLWWCPARETKGFATDDDGLS